jgi:hypothetical protein
MNYEATINIFTIYCERLFEVLSTGISQSDGFAPLSRLRVYCVIAYSISDYADRFLILCLYSGDYCHQGLMLQIPLSPAIFWSSLLIIPLALVTMGIFSRKKHFVLSGRVSNV